jgi:transposase-like protein
MPSSAHHSFGAEFNAKASQFYPEAMSQRCAGHFYRNVWTAVPTSKAKEVAAMPPSFLAVGSVR